MTERQRDIVKTSVGAGPHRKVVLSSRISNDDVKGSEDAAIPVPSLEFGNLALRNAELLLSRIKMDPSGEGIRQNSRFNKYIHYLLLGYRKSGKRRD